MNIKETENNLTNSYEQELLNRIDKMEEKINVLIQENKRLIESKSEINKLPMWTEIHIQPINIDDIKNSKVYWIKTPHMKKSVYDNDLEIAVKEFNELYKTEVK